MSEVRVVSAQPASPAEEVVERALRPTRLADYVGQAKIREQLRLDQQFASSLTDGGGADAIATGEGQSKCNLLGALQANADVNLRQSSTFLAQCVEGNAFQCLMLQWQQGNEPRAGT